MKRKMSLFLSVLGILFLAAGMMTSRALAATPDCFSDVTTHWAEDFICWMKDNGLTSGYPDGTFRPDNPITRAEVAVFLRQIRTTGVVQVNTGPTGFQPATGDNGTIQYFAGETRLKSTSGNFNNSFISSVTIPSSLYNSRMVLNAVKICYSLQGGGYISSVNFSLYSSSGSVIDGVSSSNDLTSDGCTTFNFSSPIGVDGGEYLQATINSAGVSSITDWVNMHSVTAYMTPSADAAVAKEAE
ncbi:MAG: S-layer homology domain-containing protein [Anaerolineales bacterium]|nr:S-layer homology domain-containing protein [Anaerolineales bacterium]